MENKKKTKKIRADELIFKKGLSESLEEAKALVYAGKAHTKSEKILKPSELLNEDSFIGIKRKQKSSFVSRGGDKLQSILSDLEEDFFFKGKTVLDVGSSTGGFTHCALKEGAIHVVALDVGSNQLSWDLRKDARVSSVEKTHIKDFKKDEHPVCDIVIADISFNSLSKLSPFIGAASDKEDLSLLLLVKPQFELPKDLVPKGGVVTNAKDRALALNSVEKAFQEQGFKLLKSIESKTKGRTGNQETFVHFKREKKILPK